MDELHAFMASYYLGIKTIHVIFVAMWSFSTAVAFRDYVVPAFKHWERDPENPELIAIRNDFMERFDRGAQMEHFAFPLLILTGFLMLWLSGWPLDKLYWFTIKLGIILLIFVPMEIVDYYISHMGGNKAKIRRSGDAQRYEAMMKFHWLFFKVSTPLVVIFIPALYYLAIAKPL